MWVDVLWTEPQVTVGAIGVAIIALGLLYLKSRTRPVYLVDYFVFRAPDRYGSAKYKLSLLQEPLSGSR